MPDLDSPRDPRQWDDIVWRPGRLAPYGPYTDAMAAEVAQREPIYMRRPLPVLGTHLTWEDLQQTGTETETEADNGTETEVETETETETQTESRDAGSTIGHPDTLRRIPNDYGVTNAEFHFLERTNNQQPGWHQPPPSGSNWQGTSLALQQAQQVQQAARLRYLQQQQHQQLQHLRQPGRLGGTSQDVPQATNSSDTSNAQPAAERTAEEQRSTIAPGQREQQVRAAAYSWSSDDLFEWPGWHERRERHE